MVKPLPIGKKQVPKGAYGKFASYLPQPSPPDLECRRGFGRVVAERHYADAVGCHPAAPAAPASSPVPPAAEKMVAFGQRITATHKEQLTRLAFRSRRNERRLLDRALSEFFAHQDSDLLRPIPQE